MRKELAIIVISFPIHEHMKDLRLGVGDGGPRIRVGDGGEEQTLASFLLPSHV